MQFDLEAFTDVAQFVIFDPEVIEARGDQGRDDFERLIDDATAKGDAIAYSYASDGGASFRVLVGESPPEAWLKRKDFGVEGARLRVPSGRIMAAGVEYVWPEVQPEDATVAEIPPGDYLVDAFDVEWDESEVDMLLRDRVSVTDIRLDRISGVLLAIGFFGIIIGLFSIVWSIMGQTWTPVKVAGVLIGGYWAIISPFLVFLFFHKGSGRVHKALDEFWKDRPGEVIWLRPVTDESSFNPGKFGSAYVESSRTEPVEDTGSVLGCISNAIGFLFVCFVIALIISLVTLWVS